MAIRVTLLLAALIAVGCTKDSPSVASAPTTSAPASTGDAAAPEALPAGWTRYESKTDGFSLNLPAGIKEIDAQSPSFKTLLQEVGKANPAIAQQIQQLTMSKVFALYAMDLDQVKKRAKFVDNVNVIHRPGGGAPPMTQEAVDQIAGALKQQLPGVAVKESEILKLPIGQAIRVVAEVPIKRPDGETVVSRSEGYYFGSGNDAYIVTYSSGDDKRSADFRKSIESFRAKS
jgi:hypothetical protein